MSAIVGLLRTNDRPATVVDLAPLMAACAGRGPDGTRVAVVGRLALGHLAFVTTPEASRERQPLCSPDGRYWLVADARVDHREALSRTLALPPTLSDAELLLAAYQRWGASAPTQVVGDYVFAVWDQLERRLFLARDPVGMRLLYYRQMDSGFLFATTLGALLAAGPATPNDAVIADFLAHRYDRVTHETFYRGILRLPQSCHLTVEASGMSHLQRYWTFGSPGPAASSDEHLEAVRSAFDDAVRAHLRATGPVGIMVSGGLDSSSVTCVAAHQRASGDGPPVRLYSLTYERAASADERQYLQALVDHCPRFAATRIPADDLWSLREEAEPGFPLDEPDLSSQRCLITALLQQATAHGCRVILSGQGGDEVLGYAYTRPSILWEMGPRHWRQEWPFFRHHLRPHQIVVGLVREALPASLVEPYFRRRRRRRWPTWLRRERVRAATLVAAPPFRLAPPPDLPPSARSVLESLQGGWFSALLAWNDREAGYFGVEYRDPFLDRRLIESLVGISWHLRYQRGSTKLLLRRIMGERLPASIAARQDHGTLQDVQWQALAGPGNATLRHLIAATVAALPGWLHAERYQAEWARWLRGEAPSLWPLLPPIYLMLWSRAHGLDLN
ncbi:MAG: asparagine synthase-related protein [Ardenticatenaceae bacterium]|nr:asparagine synthase-related protein [Ardenticatenaceae bacterium]